MLRRALELWILLERHACTLFAIFRLFTDHLCPCKLKSSLVENPVYPGILESLDNVTRGFLNSRLDSNSATWTTHFPRRPARSAWKYCNRVLASLSTLVVILCAPLVSRI